LAAVHGSAADPAEGDCSAPQLPSLTKRGEEGKGREEMGKGGRRGEERGRERVP